MRNLCEIMQTQGIKQRTRILKILSSKGFISGEQIAGICNISRIAVWKHISYLINNGVKIKVHSNKGYEFAGFGHRLLPEIIKLYLGKEKFIKDIIYFDEVDSTNNAAKEILKEKNLIIAEQQKKGRGRSGKYWKSEKYKDILCSVIFSPQVPYYYLPIFNIIGSLSVAVALNKLYKIKAKTKWPNDVLINNKKISGVLVEFIAEFDLIDKLILGIGVDVNSQPKFKNSTSLSVLMGDKVDRAKLLNRIIYELEKLYLLIEDKKFEKIQKIWIRYSLDYKQKVKIIQENQRLIGVSLGIDNYGNLILKKGRKNQIVYPANSLRLL